MHTASLTEYKNSAKNDTNQNIFCKEYLMTVAMVAYLRKNFYLTEIVNEKIGIFHAAGLINFWDKRSKTSIAPPTNDHNRRKPITFDNLEAMFTVFLYACGVGAFCCLAEMVLHFLK